MELGAIPTLRCYQPRWSRTSESYFCIRIPAEVAILSISRKKKKKKAPTGSDSQSCLLGRYRKAALVSRHLGYHIALFEGNKPRTGGDQSQTTLTMSFRASSFVNYIGPLFSTSLHLDNRIVKQVWNHMSASTTIGGALKHEKGYLSTAVFHFHQRLACCW